MLTDRPAYAQKRVVDLTGLTRSQVQFLTEKAGIIPRVENPHGRGKQRLYSEANLVEFLIAKELIRFGVSYRAIGEIIEGARKDDIRLWVNPAIRAATGKPAPAYAYIFWSPEDKAWRGRFIPGGGVERHDFTDMAFRGDHRAVLVVDVRGIIEEVRRRVGEA